MFFFYTQLHKLCKHYTGNTHHLKLEILCRRQQHVLRVTKFRNNFFHAKLVLKEMNILSVYETNIF